MRLLLALSIAMTFALSAEAQMRRRVASSGNTHELMTNLSGGVFQSGKESKNGSSGTVLHVGASYLRYWKDNIQFGGEGFFINASESRSGVGKSVTRIELLGVAAYNFSYDIDNAFFAKAGIGLVSVPNSATPGPDNYENQLGFFVGGGKRFNWMGNISYSPEIRLVKRGDIDMGIDIHFLNFSIFW